MITLRAGMFVFWLLAAYFSWPLQAQATSPSGETQGVVPLGIALESYAYPYPVHFLEFEMQHQLVRMA